MPTATSTSSPPPRPSNYWQQTLQNRMLLVVLAMVVLVPLLASPANEAMNHAANVALRIMATLLAVILVLRARVATRGSEVAEFLGTGPNLAVLLYCLASALSLLTVHAEMDPLSRQQMHRLSLSVFLHVQTGTLLYFAIAYHVRRSEHLVKIQDALIWIAGLMAILGLVSYGLVNFVVRSDVPASPFGDHQLYGAFLMILFPITIIAAFAGRAAEAGPPPGQSRVWFVLHQSLPQVFAALIAIGLLMTGTRTAWLGALVELLVLGLCSMIVPRAGRTQSPTRRRQFLIPMLILLTCIGLFAALGGIGPLVDVRIGKESQAKSIIFRKKMWYAAEQMLVRKPAFGYGLGSYAVYQHQFSGYGRPGKMVLESKPDLWDNAHSFWMQTAAEQGVVGVFLFAAILVTFWIAGIQRLFHLSGGIRRSLLLGCLAATAGFAIDAIANPAWEFGQVVMFFWLVLGLGVACLRPRNPRAHG